MDRQHEPDNNTETGLQTNLTPEAFSKFMYSLGVVSGTLQAQIDVRV